MSEEIVMEKRKFGDTKLGRGLARVRRWLLWLFAGIGGLVTLLFLVFVGLLIWAVRHGDSERAGKKNEGKSVVAVYQYAGDVGEGFRERSLFAGLGNMDVPPTFLEITQSVKRAGRDANVRAVVFDLTQVRFDLAQLEELQVLIRGIRAGGKDVWVYGESYDGQAAMLGGVSNHFVLLPQADVRFHGIGTQSFYFKGLLDRLGVQAQVIHIGDFKSYGEEYYRTEPSESAAAQQKALVDSMQQNVLQEVGLARGKSVEQVQALMDQGDQTVGDLQKNAWIDHSWYRTQLNDELKKAYPDAVLDRSYAMDREDRVWKNLFQNWEKKADGVMSKDYVAVVVMDGAISDESVADVRKELLRLSQDFYAKAVVFRVNSPGGSALASDVLWEATQRWKATKRPFVVSMGGVAASGGYYIAAGADQIFADPSTLTGSIGVVGMKFVFGGAMQNLGVTSHTEERGKFAGLNRLDRAYSDVEAEAIRGSMNRVYGVFKSRVQTGRGEKLQGDLESLAGGRVYAGSRALGLGLVDQLGGLQDAMAYARKAAKLGDDVEVRQFPQMDPTFAKIFHAGGEGDDVLVSRVSVGKGQPWMELWQKQVTEKTVPPLMRKPLLQLWQQMVEAERCKVWLVAPPTNAVF